MPSAWWAATPNGSPQLDSRTARITIDAGSFASRELRYAAVADKGRYHGWNGQNLSFNAFQRIHLKGDPLKEGN